MFESSHGCTTWALISDPEPDECVRRVLNGKYFGQPCCGIANNTRGEHDSQSGRQGSLPKLCSNLAKCIDVFQHNSAYTTPIDTAVSFVGPPDRSTPRAQTRQDYEEEIRRRSVRMSVNLAGTGGSTF